VKKNIQYNVAILFFVSFCSFLLYQGNLFAASRHLEYDYYEGRPPGTFAQRQIADIQEQASGDKFITFKIKGDDYVNDQEFTLDSKGQTSSFKAVHEKDKIDCSGERKENQLLVKGIYKGKEIDKKLKIDEKPFYFEPKFSLSAFVLSDEEEIRFWVIPLEKLKVYPMQAKKLGSEILEINGEDVKTVKVYYAATGIGESYYHRHYYYRASDGVFVKKEDPKGSGGTTTLVNEVSNE